MLDDVAARRGDHRDPVGAGHAAPAASSPPAASAASRCARCRRPSSCSPAASNLMRQVREVRVEDVLGREPVRVEIDRVGAYLRGRIVLVTGAGGSIGSELCRQIARVRPRAARAASRTPRTPSSRSGASSRRSATSRRAAPVLADCKDATRMREVFARAPPDGRLPRGRLQARAADGGEPGRGGAQQRRRHAHRGRPRPARPACERFVLVSTDKAVSPATVMGASKALAEWAVGGGAEPLHGHALRVRALRQRARLVAGRVVPIFRRQIAAGRPGHGHRPGDDPLLHDDPRGGAADHPRGRAARAAARSSCSRWASR